MSESSLKFQQLQYKFAAHIRDPGNAPAPEGIEDRRMGVYRDLFFNNLSSLLARTFPVVYQLCEGDLWNALIRGFMREHQAHTPLFLELPKEFVDYLRLRNLNDAGDLPFLSELAHYEWAELALSVAPDVATADDIQADGDLLNNAVFLSPYVWLFSYAYPVHRISLEYQPDSPGNEMTHLAVYRRDDDEIGFLELNAVSAQLITLIQNSDNRLSGAALAAEITRQLQHPNPDVVVRGGLDILENLRELGIVLGTRAH
ncbi:MAG: putative DNA-binding domain-containing protein [Pseudomonadota bacterium]